MKLKTLLATSVLMSAQAMATQTYVKPLDDGMDQAILESFNDAISSSAIDEVNGIGLDKIKNAIATLRINNNQFEIIRNWLKENIHTYGATLTADEILNKVTHESFNPQYYVDYLKEKYTKLYNI